jgi:hypothetical protein
MERSAIMPGQETEAQCRKDFILDVKSEWPPSSEEEEPLFSLSMSLRRRGIPPRPGQPLRQAGDPFFLECAHHLLVQLACEALGDGWGIRVDVPRDHLTDGAWPRWCSTASQVDAVLRELTSNARHPDHSMVYPLAIWFVPADLAVVERAIEVSKAMQMDEGLFLRVLRLGALRLAVFDAFADLLGDLEQGERALTWVRAAVVHVGYEGLRWRVSPGDE